MEGEKAGTSHPQRQPSNYERNQHDLDDKDVADIQAIIPLLGGCHFFTSRGSKYFPSTNMTPPPLSSSQENRDPLSGTTENHDIPPPVRKLFLRPFQGLIYNISLVNSDNL